MTTLTAPEELDVATPPRDRSQLRLRRAGRLQHTIDLSDGKWSIGSSPRCQVRLPVGESQPLQCLLSLNANSAEVTRWAAGVLLNGREFVRQTLAAGDRLTIGGWELEWQPATSDRRSQLGRKSPLESFEPELAATPAPKPEAMLAPVTPPAPERETIDDIPPAAHDGGLAKAPVNDAADEPGVEATPWEPQSPAAPQTTNAEALGRPTELPESVPAASGLLIVEEFDIGSDADQALPPLRPAAKTVLVSSRLTDPFVGLLGPAPQAPTTPAITATPFNAGAAAFEDRLVLGLWQGRYAARDRTRRLIDAMREAQARVAELKTAIAEIEQRVASQTAQAAAEAADLASQVVRLETELADVQTDRQQIAAELETLRNARPKTAPPDPRLQVLADELTQAQHEAGELRNQLAAQEAELESIRTQAEAAEADRRAEAEQFAAAQESSRNLGEEFAVARAAWEQQRAAAGADADRQREQLYACEMQIEELRGQVAEADAARAAAAEQFATAQEASRIRDEEFTADRAAWEQQYAAAGADADRLREQLYACEMQIEELRGQVAEADAARAAAAEQFATAQEASRIRDEEFAAERAAWEQQGAEADANVNRLREQLNACERQIEELRGQVAEADEARVAAAEQFATAQEASRIRDEEFTADRAAWEQQYAAASADADRLREQLNACEQQIEELRSQAAEADAARTAAAEQLATAQEASRIRDEAFTADRAAWEQQYAAAGADADRLREQLYACEMQIEELRSQVAEADAARTAVAEQLALAQSASQIHDEELAAERGAWEQQRAAADADAERLREQLNARERQIEELRERASAADAARAAVAQQLATAQERQSQWLAECRTLQEEHVATLAGVTAERDGLQEQLEQLAATLSQREAMRAEASLQPARDVDWADPAGEIAEGAQSGEDAAAPASNWGSWATAEPHGAIAASESARATLVDAVPAVAAVCPVPADDDDSAGVQSFEPMTDRAGSPPEVVSPSESLAAVEPPSTSYEPTSFIDKYRHLLEEGGNAEPSPRLSRPTLDDEYHSTRASAAAPAADEDTDEALEAYMSNLMRRVRGDGSSSSASAAARFLDTAPAATAEEVLAPVLPEPVAEPEIEVDANGMLRLARRQPPMSTDLSAMRELANSSARTAIARHRQRRHTELALSKGVICVLASGSSAYLLLTAPSVQSPWFWGGCAALAAAAMTGMQLAVHAWQRLRDGLARRRAARFFQDEHGRSTAPVAVEDVGATS